MAHSEGIHCSCRGPQFGSLPALIYLCLQLSSSNLKRSDIFSWPLQASNTQEVHRDMCPQNTHTPNSFLNYVGYFSISVLNVHMCVLCLQPGVWAEVREQCVLYFYCVLNIELKSLGLLAGTFTHRAILLGHGICCLEMLVASIPL